MSLVLAAALLALQFPIQEPCVWPAKPELSEPDTHVAFRRQFTSSGGDVWINLLCPDPFEAFVDGRRVLDGPFRFPKDHPEYQSVQLLKLKSGRHVLAVHVHHQGVDTRMMPASQPFLWGFERGSGVVDSGWKSSVLPGYSKRVARINPQLAWIEWSDSRLNPADWTGLNFDDRAWESPSAIPFDQSHIRRVSAHNLNETFMSISPMAHGDLSETFGYEADDPAARFFLADLQPKNVPPQGIWRRYDLGKVRLGHPLFRIDAPAGSVVETALSETLVHGRVSPWITLSAGKSCNLSHEVARGGVQTFTSLNPRGGRFLELHVYSTGPVRILDEKFLNHSYHFEPKGSFACPDPLLNRIWQEGVETYRSCAEDAVIDSPTRERGQWTGDEAVSMDVAAAAYDDLSLVRRGLTQAGQTARDDGLVAGLGPGTPSYLSTYAAFWTTACVRYCELTGDREFLLGLMPYAERNIDAFGQKLTKDGLTGDLGWAFVDWGYEPNAGSDMVLNIAHLLQLRAMVRWCNLVREQSNAPKYEQKALVMEGIIRSWLESQLARPNPWQQIGFQRAVFLLKAHLLSPAQRAEAVKMIKTHILSCFPLNPHGPRLSDPSVSGNRFFTPYFANFALAELWEAGEGDFALAVTKKAWGWMIEQGATTWMEVFDARWSWCHAWSACPTWQLSRYVLGVNLRQDLGPDTVELRAWPCGLKSASGAVPVGGSEPMRVKWTTVSHARRYEIDAPHRINLILPNGQKLTLLGHWSGDITVTP